MIYIYILYQAYAAGSRVTHGENTGLQEYFIDDKQQTILQTTAILKII